MMAKEVVVSQPCYVSLFVLHCWVCGECRRAMHFLREKDYAITAIGSYIFELSVCNQAAWFTHVNKYMFQYRARFVSGLYEINLGLIYIQITLIGLSGIRWYLCIYNPSTMNQNSRHGKSTSEWWDYLTSHRYHRKKIHQPLSPRDRLQL